MCIHARVQPTYEFEGKNVFLRPSSVNHSRSMRALISPGPFCLLFSFERKFLFLSSSSADISADDTVARPLENKLNSALAKQTTCVDNKHRRGGLFSVIGISIRCVAARLESQLYRSWTSTNKFGTFPPHGFVNERRKRKQEAQVPWPLVCPSRAALLLSQVEALIHEKKNPNCEP